MKRIDQNKGFNRMHLMLLFSILATVSVLCHADVGEQRCDKNIDSSCVAPYTTEEKIEGHKYTYATSNPPGYFPTEFLQVSVVNIKDETHDSKVITFALPQDASLNLPVSSALLMRAGDNNSKTMKPYNPISSNSKLGSFQLLVKIYPDGKVSGFVDQLVVGDMVAFKQTKRNVKKFRHPFNNVKRITMIAGGTGIAPMIQALHALLEDPTDETKIRLLYGNKTPNDIMLRAELDDLVKRYRDRLEVYYVVGQEEVDEKHADLNKDNFYYETGWINEEKIRRLAFPVGEGSIVWVCGVDAMYDSLAGSRAKPLSEGSALHNLGYRDDSVWRS